MQIKLEFVIDNAHAHALVSFVPINAEIRAIDNQSDSRIVIVTV